MGRAKITMEPISDPKKRKFTFNIRNENMIQKARQLATLCDINVPMILYSDDQETPQIFSPDHDQLKRLIDVYKRTGPEGIKYYALSDYYTDRKIKIEEELVKAKKKNLEAKFPSWFDFLDNCTEAGLRKFAEGLEKKNH
ncbi:agamous-like MADS-box protein AGL21 [Bidens hawaiensis]|uniref:agamous-like MADS-box protein AGL21 n=1 Tax=Bidens hawaiensis TaxID=980011 RepID=UPI00404BA347